MFAPTVQIAFWVFCLEKQNVENPRAMVYLTVPHNTFAIQYKEIFLIHVKYRQPRRGILHTRLLITQHFLIVFTQFSSSICDTISYARTGKNILFNY